MTSARFNRDGLPDAIGGLVLAITCAIMLWQTYGLPTSTAFFPKIILVISIGLSGVLMIGGIIKMIKSENKAKFFVNFKRFSYAIVLAFSYIIFVNVIGFFTSTLFFIPIVSYRFGYKNLKYSFLYSFLFCGTIFIVFVLGFDRPLPTEFFMTK